MPTTKQTKILDFNDGPLEGVRLEWRGRRLYVKPQTVGDGAIIKSRDNLHAAALCMLRLNTDDESGDHCRVLLRCVVRAATIPLDKLGYIWLHMPQPQLAENYESSTIHGASPVGPRKSLRPYTVTFRRTASITSYGCIEIGCKILTVNEATKYQAQVRRFLVDIGAIDS
ncbi:hypothetical protein LCGC14_1636900 [marine sediment metagenome]|uniref:Uncharacterized protein n=1 Tax=marine sediment metagenome TaxID=412755 RepID=A0A0F9I0V5_9ZZZZ